MIDEKSSDERHEISVISLCGGAYQPVTKYRADRLSMIRSVNSAVSEPQRNRLLFIMGEENV